MCKEEIETSSEGKKSRVLEKILKMHSQRTSEKSV
jgi:hypothetical protein